MGIVVSVAMLLALAMMLFNKRLKNKKQSAVMLGIGFVALSGIWNSAWYGVQNVPSFWGFAGLLSGLFMLASALILYLEMRTPKIIESCTYAAFRLSVMIGLSLYLLLYVVTIVQINLGLPIIH